MAILAAGAVVHAAPGYVVVSGTSLDGSAHFDENSGTINVYVDFASSTLKADIEAGLKAKLEAAPYNMTFGGGDTALIVP